MTIAQVVEKSVTVNNNSPIQDYVSPGLSNSTYFSYIDLARAKSEAPVNKFIT